ncbi:hypothetical protein MCOR27_008292 [Pyricularia oryzae]|uniref:DUF7732 domain-containing protein n=1 Tax=Pyricularia oryzae TaxID=318829 RepID=A0A4P7NKF0_PYROR|nr:hypothetical protein MCOR19_011255 [Pyricularia oryzae]KAI6268637.1 hypothetical protein MCOR26_009118 [Pyricularia oryzae]KAI6272526.1 hypothetical protein MCOR27_008292 [Pyricularia oryzae]KAI6307769.1 hypothetical protein MCOR34_007456 [Pyricularia oryzae]KAI6323948.1 hypothetical protein MCOR29_004231 [Pyricularia oryzae]
MKPSTLLFFVTCLTGPAVDAAAISEKETTHIRYSQFPSYEKRDTSEAHDLWKRKGGGRGGGSSGGGRSSGRTGGSSGSTGGRSSSSPSTGGGTGSGARSPTSNSGGVSSGGSGPKPAYGGGSVYAGGARRPYQSGSRIGAITPFLLVGAVALAFWPWSYAHGAYMYPYHNPYHYYNASSQRNETRNVLCGCQEYEVCGCDEENNGTVKELVGDGSYDKMDKSVVNVADVNGTQTIVIDGSLPNGTTADSAAAQLLLTHASWWPVVATVAAIVIWV